MPMKFARRHQEDGFTMIELLVVVIIIAILAAVAVPVYIGIQNNAKKSAMRHDVDTTRLSVAAMITEDGVVNSGQTTATVGAQVYNSKSPADEIVEVSVNDDKSYTVTASSASLDFSVKYASAGATNSTANAVGTASAPYCIVTNTYSTVPKMSTTFVDPASLGLYNPTVYYKNMESTYNSAWTTSDQAATLSRLNAFQTAYQQTEATQHTDAMTDAQATAYASKLQENFGWVTYLDKTDPNAYLLYSYPGGGSQYEYLAIAKGGSSATRYIFSATSNPNTSLGNQYGNNTYRYNVYAGYLSVNGSTPEKGWYTSSQLTSTSTPYHTYIAWGGASCK